MNDKSKMFRVYPTEPVRGYTHTYCITEDDAWEELMNMEEQTGVEWAIEFPDWAIQKESVLNDLFDLLERTTDSVLAGRLQKTIVTIDKGWRN